VFFVLILFIDQSDHVQPSCFDHVLRHDLGRLSDLRALRHGKRTDADVLVDPVSQAQRRRVHQTERITLGEKPVHMPIPPGPSVVDGTVGAVQTSAPQKKRRVLERRIVLQRTKIAQTTVLQTSVEGVNHGFHTIALHPLEPA
jgi:hypothetical protein